MINPCTIKIWLQLFILFLKLALMQSCPFTYTLLRVAFWKSLGSKKWSPMWQSVPNATTSQSHTTKVALSLWDMFAKLWKANVSFVMSFSWLVCLSVCTEQLSPTERIVMKFYIGILSVEKIQVLLKSENNNGYFTWRPICIYNHISLSS